MLPCAQVRTKLLSAIDVDMMISKTLSDELVKPGRIQELEKLAAGKVATVLPAFEPKRQGPAGRTIADAVALGESHAVPAQTTCCSLLLHPLALDLSPHITTATHPNCCHISVAVHFVAAESTLRAMVFVASCLPWLQLASSASCRCSGPGTYCSSNSRCSHGATHPPTTHGGSRQTSRTR